MNTVELNVGRWKALDFVPSNIYVVAYMFLENQLKRRSLVMTRDDAAATEETPQSHTV